MNQPTQPKVVETYKFLNQPIGEALAKLNGHGVTFWSAGSAPSGTGMDVAVLLVSGPLADPICGEVSALVAKVQAAIDATPAST